MTPPLLRCLAIASCFVYISTAAELNQEQLAAINLDSSDTLELEIGQNTSIEVVSLAEATSGQALQLTIPHEEELKLTWTNAEIPGLFDLRFKLTSTSNRQLQYEYSSFSGGDDIEIAPDENGWNTAKLRVPAFSTTGPSISLRAGNSNDAEKNDRILLLDSFESTPGYQLLTTASEGITIERFPDQETYAEGTSVVLAATHSKDNSEIWSWAYAYGTGNEANMVKIDSHTAIHAAGALHYDFGTGEIAIPMDDISHTVLSEENEPLKIELESDNNASIRFTAQGPGYIEFTSKKLSGNSAWIQRANFQNTAEAETQRIWIGEGLVNVFAGFKGHLEISDIKAVPAVQAELTITGNGTVDGLPLDGIYSPGSTLQLTATPADGWLFEGWHGAVKSSQNSIEGTAFSRMDIQAIFYKEVTHRGQTIRVYDDHAWAFSDTEIATGFPLAEGETAGIGLEVQGPGALAFTARDDDYDFRLTTEGTDQYQDLGSRDPTDYRIEILAGARLIKIVNEPSSFNVSAIDLLISELDWHPGVTLNLSSTTGGSVAGAASGQSTIPYLQTTTLEAQPAEGFQFLRWEGDIDSDQAILEIAPDQPISLKAVFEKVVTDSFWVKSLSGDLLWESLGDETWKSPSTFSKGQSAGLSGTISGPIILNVDIEGSISELKYAIDDGPPNSLWNGTNIDIPSGDHSLHIFTESRWGNDEAMTLKFTRLYPVAITLPGGDLNSTPDTHFDYLTDTYKVYIEHGQSFSFEAINHGGLAFSGWDGDLAGKATSDSITVENPITASGSYLPGAPIAGGILWTTSPPDSAFPQQGIHLFPANPTIETTFFADVTGPGTLSFSIFEYDYCTTVQLDNEELPATTVEREYSAWRIPIESGNHTVSIYRPAFEDRGDLCNGASIRYINYTPGFHIDTSGPGGVIELTPPGGTYDSGTQITVSATPSEGNRFASWQGDFANQSATLQHTVSGHTSSQAIFEAVDTLHNIRWIHQGRRPAYDKGQNAFIFSVNESNADTTSIKSTITGPVSLNIQPASSPWSPFFAQLLIDGEPAQPAFNGSVLIGTGSHEIEWQIERYPDRPVSPTTDYIVYAYAPIPTHTATVSATSATADISISPDKTEYNIGETITLTAPEEDNASQPFKGWWNPVLWRWHSSDRILEQTLESDLQLEARYGGLPLNIPQSIVTLENGDHSWSIEETLLSPTGEKPIRIEDDARIILSPLTSNTQTLYFKSVGDTPNLKITVGYQGTLYSSTGPQDWHKLVIHQNAGENTFLEIATLSTGDAILLADFSSNETWSPTILPEGMGALEFTPQLHQSSEGDLVTAKPQSTQTFKGWMIDRELVDATTLTFTYGETTSLLPVFAPQLQGPLGEYYQIPHHSWEFEQDSDGLYSLYAADAQSNPPIPPYLHLEIEGPKVLTWSQESSSMTVAIALDGEQKLYPSNGFSPFKHHLQIPAGLHSVSFSTIDNKTSGLRLDALQLLPGYALPEERANNGFTQYSPSKPAHTSGTSVIATAIPHEGFHFEAWQAPYADKPQSFDFVVGQDSPPVPLFTPIHSTVQILGLDWKVTNGITTLKTSQSDEYTAKVAYHKEAYIKRINSDYPVSLDTKIVGPKVIRINPDNSSATGIWNILKIDGVSAKQKPNRYAYRGDETLIQIPAGEHKLELSPHSSHLDLDASYVQILDGHLVEVRGTGVSTHVEPLLSSYPTGTQLNISAIGARTGANIEWLGLPTEDQTNAQSLSIDVQTGLDIEALYWRSATLFGIDLLYASNHQWEKAEYEGLQQTRFKERERSLIRFTPPADSIVHYTYETDHLTIDLDAKVGETVINKREREGYHISTESIRIPDPSEQLTISTQESSGWRAGGYTVLFLRNLSIQTSTTSSRYLSWWDRYNPQGLRPNLWNDLIGDIDGDGLTNYAEYLLDYDPFDINPILSIEQNQNGTTYLKQSNADLSLLDPRIEYTFSLNDRWKNASNILKLKSPSEDENFHIYDLLLDAEQSEELYFRLRYSFTVPEIETLTNPQ